jgi:hypothetical protein
MKSVQCESGDIPGSNKASNVFWVDIDDWVCAPGGLLVVSFDLAWKLEPWDCGMEESVLSYSDRESALQRSEEIVMADLDCPCGA